MNCTKPILRKIAIASLVYLACGLWGNALVLADSSQSNPPILPDTAIELDAYIQQEFKKTHIPAMSVEIVDAQGVAFSGSYGEGSTLDTPYILGSISKSFTAVAIMQLVEQGKIVLADPIAAYLPSVNSDCKTTVKQLLNQTSGIHTYMTLENYRTPNTTTGWEYANVNYNLLGQIVERVSGIPYGDYIKAHIFKPLQMNHSYVSLEAAKDGGLISGHRNYFGLMIAETVGYPKDTTSGWMTVPAAYIISTANDMGKYLQFYLNGGKGILTPESIHLMHTDTVFAKTDYEYGYGWGVDKRVDETLLSHGGKVENYTTYMFILPDRNLAGIFLFNACDYFVANDMAFQLPYQIARKLMGLKTDDISASAYTRSHLLINGILAMMLLIGLLPLIRIKKWCGKYKEALNAKGIAFLVLIHAVLPTLLLTMGAVLGIPIAVIARFAPDVFLVQGISSALLYLVGAFKVIYRAKSLPRIGCRFIR
ncbi:MAG: serine hydrolase domain-containing protein [Clostridia bacterium]